MALNDWADKRAYVYASLSEIGKLHNDDTLQQRYAEQAAQQDSPRWAYIELLVAQDHLN